MNKVFLHLTYDCNADCLHCAVPKDSKDLSFRNYKSLIDTLSENNIEYVILNGGEPLLSNKLEDIIEYGYDRNLKMKVETNGYFINKSFLNKINDKIFQINVSLDGIKEDTHNQIRNLGTFNHTVEMIKYARKLGIDVAIWNVIMKPNLEEADKMIDFAEEIGVNKLSFLYSTPVGKCYDNRKDLLVDYDTYYQKFKKLMD